MLRHIPLKVRIQLFCGLVSLLVLGYAYSALQEARGQGGPSAETANAASPEPTSDASAEQLAKEPDKSINLINLYFQGGIFMYPITALSIIGTIAAIERGFGLRRTRVVPEPLIGALGQLATQPGGFDPRRAFKICQQYPSTAATVVRTMLLRVGRPIPEIESAVAASSDSEATKLYYNVRWLNLVASTATMFGLLGTIQGMILAFHQMTLLTPGMDKMPVLSAGIYTALVTTAAGLIVAIPAVMMAHYYEGRIQTMFHEISDLVQSLLPQLERYEGRVRFGKSMEEETLAPPLPAAAAR